MLISFACSNSKDDFDTSPFHNKELLAYTPFSDLIDAVLVYKDKHGEFPNNISSIKNLSREDYINACITDGVADSIIVDDSDLTFFGETSTTFELKPNRLQIHYALKDSTFKIQYEESLYSKDFDTYLFQSFDVWVKIKESQGTLFFDFDSNTTEIQVDKMSVEFDLGDEKMVVENETSLFENPEPVCFEE